MLLKVDILAGCHHFDRYGLMSHVMVVIILINNILGMIAFDINHRRGEVPCPCVKCPFLNRALTVR